MGNPEGPTPFSENDIDRWVAEAGSDRGYTGGHMGPSRPGPPVVGARLRPPRIDGMARPAENPSSPGERRSGGVNSPGAGRVHVLLNHDIGDYSAVWQAAEGNDHRAFESTSAREVVQWALDQPAESRHINDGSWPGELTAEYLLRHDLR